MTCLGVVPREDDPMARVDPARAEVADLYSNHLGLSPSLAPPAGRAARRPWFPPLCARPSPLTSLPQSVCAAACLAAWVVVLGAPAAPFSHSFFRRHAW